jgi:hypothetical protein
MDPVYVSGSAKAEAMRASADFFAKTNLIVSAAGEAALKGTSNSGVVEFLEEKKSPQQPSSTTGMPRLLIDENGGGKPLAKLEPATILSSMNATPRTFCRQIASKCIALGTPGALI